MLKAPLSGSGKGLNWCKGIFTTFISGWCARVAASQGGVVGEPIYNKVEDFAMEFYADRICTAFVLENVTFAASSASFCSFFATILYVYVLPDDTFLSV